ncbi:GNAT family N-acetyltransferase [Paenibacillus terrigena]|uniref:GNAT family N-acetyltransferase n=1 Tax=Paenibacillus terrigena TaxID=369333 RepID=UPI00035E2DA9|nr:GNAT family N-acetyltransferase [Paenibacillus terrigena]
MADIRRLQSEQEWKEAIALSDATFRDHEHRSMGEAYPYVFSSSLGQSYGAFVDGRLVSFMGLVPAVIRIGPAALNVYSLGSVCTHPDYRGQGIAGDILSEIFSHIDDADGTMLFVSGSRSLYSRAGCYPFGRVYGCRYDSSHLSSQELREAIDHFVIREIQSTDWFQLHHLTQGESVRYEQSLWDLAQLIEAGAVASNRKHTMHSLVAEREGKVQAFIVYSIPTAASTEVSPEVYHYAGDRATIHMLFERAMATLAAAGLNITVPAHDLEMQEQLKHVHHEERKCGGTLKIIRSERLLEQLRPYLATQSSEVAEQIAVSSLENGHTWITVGDRSVEVTPEELLDVLFGSNEAISMEEELRTLLNHVFPVPLPFNGGLNFV